MMDTKTREEVIDAISMLVWHGATTIKLEFPPAGLDDGSIITPNINDVSKIRAALRNEHRVLVSSEDFETATTLTVSVLM